MVGPDEGRRADQTGNRKNWRGSGRALEQVALTADRSTISGEIKGDKEQRKDCLNHEQLIQSQVPLM